jgi:hypothetical protein
VAATAITVSLGPNVAATMGDRTYHSVTGAPEMAEPSNTLITTADHQSSALPSNSKTQPSNSSLPAPKKVSSTQTTSTTNSPKPSRESSPIRSELTSNSQSRAGGWSRKNSHQEPSPTRSASAISSIPSSAAVARKPFSSATVPQLRPTVSDTTIKAPIPQKAALPAEPRDLPRWPISPRLRSPPPVIKALTSPRKADQEAPAINVHTPTPTTSEETHQVTEGDESLALPGMRSPVRGPSGAGSTLETVQEISQPSTPALSLDGSRELSHGAVKQLLEQGNAIDQVIAKPLKSKSGAAAADSGSESGGNKGEIKMRAASLAPPTTVPPNSVAPTKSHSSSSALSRGKTSAEGSAKNMTVETETVSSIPQVAVGGGAGGVGNNGSLRAKPSSETIRPKKEKKKTGRKAPSINAGTGEPPDSSNRSRQRHHHSARSLSDFLFFSPTNPDSTDTSSTYSLSGAASPQKWTVLRRPSLNLYNVSTMLTRQLRAASSKAEIFEAKIASAVDEANSSDSEETFVYESNPPEMNERPRRFHSRTPSATSMASQVDQRGNPRSIQGVMDGVHGVAMKKSMKFANSYNNSNPPDSTTGEDDGKGTVRSNMGTGRGTTHHHHIGRWGRNGGNGHPSLFDNESPFPNAAKSKLGGNTSRNSSRPTSPRVPNGRTGNGKKSSPVSSGYDIDDGTGADDERTPLMGSTIRSNRPRRGQRQPFSSIRQLEHQESRQMPSMLNRFAGCLVLSIMILLVISGAIGFLFATTQPLTDVKVLSLQHVVATEQELMLDMEVVARNPNIVVISVDTADIDIFAKSKHSEDDWNWWDRQQLSSHVEQRRRDFSRIHTLDDSPDDPYDDPDETTTTLLGSVFSLDSSLTFDGSPFKHTRSICTGQLRLAKPGNTGEADNSERWQRILKYEYELILKGTLKYQLPMSSRIRNVSIDARLKVTPNSDDKRVAGEFVLID